MRQTLDWEPFYAVAREADLPYREKLRRYAAIARQRFELERFQEFCDTHLAHLPQVADEFFASPGCRDAVRLKVGALYPEHEVEPFTDLFFGRIQSWREAERAGAPPAQPVAGARSGPLAMPRTRSPSAAAPGRGSSPGRRSSGSRCRRPPGSRGG